MEYLGSKAKLVSEFKRIITQNLKPKGVYIEPFCGGCSVAESLVEMGYDIRLYDINEILIEFFKKGQEGYVPPLSPKIKSNDEKNQILKSTAPLWEKGEVTYLNSFRGTRWGFDKDVYNRRRNSYLNTVSALKSVLFKTQSYLDLDFKELDPENTLIYCDIPYLGTRIDGYCRDSLKFNHNIFWQWVREHKEFKILVSEIQAPKDFVPIWRREFKHKIGTNDNNSHKIVEECLYVYRDTVSKWNTITQRRMRLR